MKARRNMTMSYEIVIDGARHSVELKPQANEASRVTITVDGRLVEADAIRISRGAYSILLGGRSLEITAEEISGGLLLHANGREYQVEIFDPRSWRRKRGA